MAKKSVQTLLDDISLLGGEQHSLVEHVRKLVKKTVSPVSEEVKYGGIIFSSGVSFCGVFAYLELSLDLGQKLPGFGFERLELAE